ncbi:hypothetical protein L1077_11110 [Pseudoalteromonas luteoviolacea]|uniref:Uncharacterized protein n=1 Tax=Pseudoalteromonas luteoviolacea H33 TaxID=1365251 RepID=A0A162ALR1_9GAMM|nr:hypothetical protein [Pseudoalteromonas luteoviolacea]KZN52112.1 hypothetical protein N476_01905 [Pseudoalteromonas luteoviolacea H33]KZN78828.1 hypothetical protein N477_08380 [Pseudoalteromonas luteoviolacea H33-S]MBQ4876192.1 hypothetical protein [Pseudoalteromonas luteoviolacea]MBQ4906226.1 hypothetical protein [Pseudoalteromonas luteoviolacea]MCF6439982.1 hypothetical protein [Pseudoalteromonas luteoviolacea]
MKLKLNKKGIKQLSQKQINSDATKQVGGGAIESKDYWCQSGQMPCWTNGPCITTPYKGCNTRGWCQDY